MRDVVVIAATRTAVGSFQGSLAGIPAPGLGAVVIRRLLEQAGLDIGQVDEVILDQVLTAGSGRNPARQVAIRADLLVGMPATTLNKVCGSGLKALHLGTQAIHCGDAEVIVTSGRENVSLAPYVMPGARTDLYVGHAELAGSVIGDGLWDASNDYHMGVAAENLAEKYGLTHEGRDAFAATSQQKAITAVEGRCFRNEATPVQVPQRKGEPLSFDTDEQPRAGTIVEALAKPEPAFRKDGSATTGSTSSLNNGAAAVLLMSAARAEALGLPVLARIANYASARVDPTIMGIGPVSVARRALDKAGWGLEQLDLIEADKAFAVQSLAVGRELGWDAARVSVDGGAITFDHPIGASGCRVLVILLYEMIRRNTKKGLAALCIGDEQGVALTLVRD